MQTNNRLSRLQAGRSTTLARTGGGLLGALAVLAAAPAFATSPVLVGAPTADDAAWDTQSGIPPTGQVYFYADQFTLTSDQYVSRISTLIFGDDAEPAFYSFALLNDLSDTTPLYSFIANSPPLVDTTVDLDVGAVLTAGTYYLELRTTGFIGWDASDGVAVTTEGTVRDGIWEKNTATDSGWTFIDGDTFAVAHPGVFAVLGADVAGSAPEPGTWALLVGGFGLLGGAMRRARWRTPGRSGDGPEARAS